jgi:outer membrane protein TolC
MSSFRDPKAEIRVGRQSVAAICLAGMLLLSGCAVGPKYHHPPVEVPPTYKEAGNWKPAQPNEQSLGGNWWEIFQDPQLNALEQQVNISNQNLKAAQARYTQARALVRYYRADYFPTVARRSIRDTRQSVQQPSAPGSTFQWRYL